MCKRRFLLKDDYLVEVERSEYAEDPCEYGCFGKIVGTGSLGYCDREVSRCEYSSLEESIEDIAGEDSVYLPIYAYSHGGVSVSTIPFSCSWDSWQEGFVYATHEDIKKEYGVVTKETIDKAKQLLDDTVKYLDDFIGMNIFEYSIYELDDKDKAYLEKIKNCDDNDYRKKRYINNFLDVVASMSYPLNSVSGFRGDDMKENGIFESILEDIPNCDTKYPNLNIEKELIEYSE